MQMWPVWSRMYPGEHSHSYDPSVSIHIPFKHTPGPSSSHSSISSHMWFAVLNRIPLGQIHCANIIKRLDWSRPIPPISWRLLKSNRGFDTPGISTCLETARGVATLATAAQRLLQFALVYIGAYLPRRVHLVAAVADATIRAHEILAATVHANVRILCTLVDIFVERD